MGASGIDDGWNGLVDNWILNNSAIIKQAFTLQCPRLQLIFIIGEGFEAIGAADNLSGIESTKECIWLMPLYLRCCDAEAYHGIVDDATFLHGM